MSHIQEEWKPVVGFEGWYQVSDQGRIRRIRKGANAKLSGPLLFSVGSRGYLICVLCKQGERKSVIVHRIVAMAFLGLPGSRKEVNHKDGNKTNNRVENLEWVTSGRNKQHGCDMGLYPLGEQVYNARFGEDDIRSIRRRIRNGERACDIAQEYGVHRGTIGNIKRRKSWIRLPD
jgi:hypothetical protein